MSEEYNGYTNYETWCVSLWIDNDCGTYTLLREMARELWDDAKETEFHSRENNARFALQEWLEGFVKEGMPEIETSMYLDLLESAIDNVNWREIAENTMEDCNFKEERDSGDDD